MLSQGRKPSRWAGPWPCVTSPPACNPSKAVSAGPTSARGEAVFQNGCPSRHLPVPRGAGVQASECMALLKVSCPTLHTRAGPSTGERAGELAAS